MRALTLNELRKMYGKKVILYDSTRNNFCNVAVETTDRKCLMAGFKFPDGSFRGYYYGESVIAYLPDLEHKICDILEQFLVKMHRISGKN